MNIEEIIKDQNNRWTSGNRKEVKDYAHDFPWLEEKENVEAAIVLIENEVALREGSGKHPHPKEYVDVFPVHRDAIFGFFESHLPSHAAPGELHIYGILVLGPILHKSNMATVYKGEQRFCTEEGSERSVAVKVLEISLGADSAEVERFRKEARALASLHHANIVPIFYWGKDQGNHWFTMKLVDGKNLAAVAAEEESGQFSPTRAAKYLKIVAEAIHYVHQKKVIHRDLKPQNIMREDNTEQLYVLDFGLAKVIPPSSETVAASGYRGTVDYLSPEMAKQESISRRTDVYGLGATLYHLLTGRPPFKGENLTDTLDQIVNDPVVAPRTYNDKIPIDLEAICLKCLEKDPRDRYGSAQEVADDLGRFLNGELPKASNPSRPRRLVNWADRRRATVVPSLSTLLLLVILGVVVGRDILRTNELPPVAANFPETSPNELPPPFGDYITVKPVLMKPSELPPVWSRPVAAGEVTTVSLSPNGKRVLAVGLDGKWGLWGTSDATGPNLLPESVARDAPVRLAGFSPDGTRIVWVCNDGAVWLWNVENHEKPQRMRSSDSVAHTPLCLAFAPEGDWLAVGLADGTVEVRNMQSPSVLTSIPAHTGGVLALDFLGASRIVSTGRDGTARLSDWSQEGENPLAPYEHDGKVVPAVACIPGDGKFVTGCEDGWVRLWDGSGKEEMRIHAHKKAVGFLAVLPKENNESLVVSASFEDGSARIWYVDRLRRVDQLEWTRSPFCAFAVATTGERIVAGEEDGWATVWDQDGTEIAYLQRKGTAAAIRSVAFSDDGQLVVTGSVDGTVAVYDLRKLAEETAIPRG